MKPVPDPVTDWSKEPLYVDLDRVAQIYGRSVPAIRRLVGLDKFHPRPTHFYPMQWSRHQLEAAWKGERAVPHFSVYVGGKRKQRRAS